MPFTESKGSDDEDVPSMDALELGKRNTIKSIPSYFGGEEEEDIPDIAEFEEPDNLIETDPVSYSWDISFGSITYMFMFVPLSFEFFLIRRVLGLD